MLSPLALPISNSRLSRKRYRINESLITLPGSLSRAPLSRLANILVPLFSAILLNCVCLPSPRAWTPTLIPLAAWHITSHIKETNVYLRPRGTESTRGGEREMKKLIERNSTLLQLKRIILVTNRALKMADTSARDHSNFDFAICKISSP